MSKMLEPSSQNFRMTDDVDKENSGGGDSKLQQTCALNNNEL